jgi:hypothetical protein
VQSQRLGLAPELHQGFPVHLMRVLDRFERRRKKISLPPN